MNAPSSRIKDQAESIVERNNPDRRSDRLSVCRNESSGRLLDDFLARSNSSCFVGLSPETSFLNKGRLTALLDWLRSKASRILVAEGSYLTRWNLIGLEGRSKREAEKMASSQHERARGRISRTIEQVKMNQSVEILDWPAVVGSKSFCDLRSELEAYTKKTPVFEKHILSIVGEFVNRRANFPLPSGQMEPLVSYVLEEIAMFVYLYKEGFKVEVYPGADLELMRQLMLGNLPNFPFNLSERTHVSISYNTA